MDDIARFLGNNAAFVPQQVHIEAIQRRCDHDADAHLNFQEFVELFYDN